MHSIKDKAVVVNGEIVVRPIMVVALTYDHRLLDGREAVTFLGSWNNSFRWFVNRCAHSCYFPYSESPRLHPGPSEDAVGVKSPLAVEERMLVVDYSAVRTCFDAMLRNTVQTVAARQIHQPGYHNNLPATS